MSNPRLLLLAALVLLLLPGCPSEDVTPPDPTPEPPPLNPWNNDGPFGEDVRSTARNFSIEVIDPGVDRDEAYAFDLRDSWTGEDSYVVLQNISANTQGFWNSSVHALLAGQCRFGACSPPSVPNVHYFFVSARGDYQSDYDAISARIEDALDLLDEDDAEFGSDHWASRLHVATQPREELGGLVEGVLVGWPSEGSSSGGWSWQGFAIDRFQRLREVGLTRYVGDGFENEMWFANNLPRHFNAEFRREQFLAENPAGATVPLWNGEVVGGGGRFAEVVLPSAEEMAGYDTLEVDITMGCIEGGADKNCFEWDYKAHMQVCEIEVDVQEPPTDCTYAFEDRLAGINIEADTQACTCASPYDGVVERVRTCNAVTDETTGETSGQWSNCPCQCGAEIARWITSYHRHGRWLTDITPSLAFLQGGGPARIKFQTSYNYEMAGELRFTNRGKDKRPISAIPLWTGGGFGANYNVNHEPITFDVPPGATGAEVVAFITGHGFNSDDANCAEFCPHHHHFSLNGGEEVTQAYDEADDWMGCIPQIDDGALPNQYGTWYLGRGGWCPGLDVPPFRGDVSADLDFDGPNTISYRASLYGQEPANAGNIWMSSYLVFYR
ncbi:MAG: hypothetical protein KDA24_21445 [Deltaproteobacteria bacterium]|nr:hypothetical protein [Deltaproteobacteria bacterium]